MEEKESSFTIVSSFKSKHKRSISDSCQIIWEEKLHDYAVKMEDVRETEERESPSNERSKAPISLKQEIQQLEKKLQDQFAVRRALEKALRQKSFDFNSSSNDNNIIINSLPNPTKELIQDITILELQVIYLEQHLLSLYRNSFNIQSNQSTLTRDNQSNRSNQSTLTGDSQSTLTGDSQSNERVLLLPRRSETGLCSVRPHERPHGIGRSHSSLLNRSARVSPAEKNLSRVLKPCFTAPLTFVEEKQDKLNSSNMISLAEHLGTKVSDHITLTPNKLSEELIRCMCTIFRKMKSFQNSSGAKMQFSSFSHSPCSSFSSSLSVFSSRNLIGDIWSPKSKRENCTEIVGLGCIVSENCTEMVKFPCNSTFEVLELCMEGCVNEEIEDLIRNYKLLIQRLETVDLKALKNEEKLAFWINIHNSIVMHAHMEKGISRNNKRRLESLNKVSYLIKGQKVNMEIIQNRILGCSKTPSSQWLIKLLFNRKVKRNGEDLQCSPVDQSEPLLHFVLCFGNRSDPVVRIYNPKRLYNQLETAKEEYIISKIQIQKENTIILPRLIESYVKDAHLNLQETLEMVERYLPQSLRVVLQNHQPRKILEWAPHDFTFRYVVSREAANFQSFV